MSLRATTEYAERLAAERRQWERPLFVAQQVKTAIENPELFGVTMRARAMLAAVPWRKTAERVLGPVLLHAATAPKGQGCQWCVARRYAEIKKLPIPQPSRAAVYLLGEPCSHYAAMSMAQRMALIGQLVADVRRSYPRPEPNPYAERLKMLLRSAVITERDSTGYPSRLSLSEGTLRRTAKGWRWDA